MEENPHIAAFFPIFSSSDIFSNLSNEKIAELINAATSIHLEAGQILFTKGTVSNSVYIVIYGLLGALDTNKDGTESIAGTIRAGQTVGEMGLISSQVRMMTIKALRPTFVLELNKLNFEKCFEGNSKALFELVNLIIKRVNKNQRLAKNTYEQKNILFLSTNETVDMQRFINCMEESFALDLQVAFVQISHLVKSFSSNIDLRKYLNKIEAEHHFIFYFFDSKDSATLSILLDYADRIILLANGFEKVSMDDFIKRELQQHHAIYIKKDLVLLYENKLSPLNTQEWRDAFECNHVYHIIYHQPRDFKRLLRYLTGKAIALVLSGGGTRGWVEIGIIKALYEKKIPVDAVGGTSIGAVIGAMYLTSSSYEEFLNKFSYLMQSIDNPFKWTNFTLPIISLLDAKQGTTSLQELFGNVCIENLTKPFFCVSCNLSQAQQVVHTHGTLWRWLRASSAIPGILPPLTYAGQIYVDGGVVNNLPTDVMRSYLEGKGFIIAVNLSSFKIFPEKYHIPETLTFWEALLFKLGLKNNKKYLFPSFSDVLLNSLLMGSTEKIKQNAANADLLIAPDVSKYGALTAYNHSENFISIGYDAALDALKDFKL